MRNIFVGCCLAVLAACGGATDGTNGTQGPGGTDGTPGVAGSAGAQGPAGAAGDAGAQGAAGASGTAGAPGATGEAGAAGAPGATGDQGDQGEVGPSGDAGAQGHIGDIWCGDELITAEEWHSACNANGGNTSDGTLVCTAGQVQCRLFFSQEEDASEELVPRKVCYDTVNHHVAVAPGDNQPGTTCNVDLDCDGVEDNTVGVGTNVALVRRSLQYECPVSGSDFSCDKTFLSGLCRNAQEHCLGSDTRCETKVDSGQVVVSCDGNGFPKTTGVSGNREGVVLADFGDLSTPTADEAKMGYECNGSDGSVYTWDCTLDANGVASVSCTGARGL